VRQKRKRIGVQQKKKPADKGQSTVGKHISRIRVSNQGMDFLAELWQLEGTICIQLQYEQLRICIFLQNRANKKWNKLLCRVRYRVRYRDRG
jgi:hypothetical protein